jgi:hypothetical protein
VIFPSDSILLNANVALSKDVSSPELASMLEITVRAFGSLGSTLIVTGLLNVASPSTVMSLSNTTGSSNVVTRFPRSPPSSSEETSSALSRNVSSPVIALIFLLPM